MKDNQTSVRLLTIAAVFVWVAGAATTAQADVFAPVTATFTDPVLIGVLVNDPASGDDTFSDDSATAVYSGVGTNSLSWGTAPDLGIPAAEQFSQLTFTGNPAVNLSSSTSQQIGTMSFLNGTSDTGTVIFGATITFYANANMLGSDSLIITTTQNQYSGTGLTTAQLQTDADWINICGFSSDICNLALASYEDSETGMLSPVVAKLTAKLDFELTDIAVTADTSNLGTVATLPALGEVPEPSSLTLTFTLLGGCGLGLMRRRRTARI